MNAFSSIANEAESLLSRNDKLARECSRLKIENRSLKILVRRLLTEELKIGGKEFEDKAVQTERILSVIKASQSNLLSPMSCNDMEQWLASPLEKTPYSPNAPSVVYIDKENRSTPELRRGGISPNKSGKSTPRNNRTSVETRVPTIISPASEVLIGAVQRTPTPLRTPPVAIGIGGSLYGDRKVSSLDTLSYAFDNIGNKPSSFSATTQDTPNSDSMFSLSKQRESRRVSRVVNYKEPSLSAKVRRGFKFFHFLNDDSNSTADK